MTQKTRDDIEYIIEACTGTWTLLDELSILRISLKAYIDGAKPDEAVAFACGEVSNSLTKS